MAANPEKSKPKATRAQTALKVQAAPKATARKTTSGKRTTQPISEEMIAERAYWISLSNGGSTDVENWLQAEAELHTS